MRPLQRLVYPIKRIAVKYHRIQRGMKIWVLHWMTLWLSIKDKFLCYKRPRAPFTTKCTCKGSQSFPGLAIIPDAHPRRLSVTFPLTLHRLTVWLRCLVLWIRRIAVTIQSWSWLSLKKRRSVSKNILALVVCVSESLRCGVGNQNCVAFVRDCRRACQERVLSGDCWRWVSMMYGLILHHVWSSCLFAWGGSWSLLAGLVSL